MQWICSIHFGWCKNSVINLIEILFWGGLKKKVLFLVVPVKCSYSPRRPSVSSVASSGPEEVDSLSSSLNSPAPVVVGQYWYNIVSTCLFFHEENPFSNIRLKIVIQTKELSLLCEFVMQIKRKLPIFIHLCNNICSGSDNKGFAINVCKLCWQNTFDWFIITDSGHDTTHETVDVNEAHEAAELQRRLKGSLQLQVRLFHDFFYKRVSFWFYIIVYIHSQ